MAAEPGLDVPEGRALNLTCHLPGGSKPMGNSTFTWFWNRHLLHTSPVPTLSFTHVTPSQAGLYHCRADLPTGVTTSAPVLLHVLCEYEPTSALTLYISSVCIRSCPLRRVSTSQAWGLGILASLLAGCVWLCIDAFILYL